MNALRSTAATAAFATAIAFTSAMPAQAQNVTLSFGQRQQVIQTYCDRYPNDYDCRGYYAGNWTRSDYDYFYRNRSNDLAPVAASVFGLALGAIIGGAIANQAPRNGDVVVGREGNYSSHVQACYARYRSYDERTDTFLGFDGIRKPCNL
jgi:hypothetical protein